MEKFSLGKSIGKNIKKIAVVTGLSTLSILPNNETENLSKADNLFFNPKDKIENNIEFKKNDLEFNKKYVQEVAFSLVKQFVERVNFQELILDNEVEIRRLYEELNLRKLFSKARGQNTFESEKEILESIKYLNEEIKDFKEILQYVENTERDNVKIPDYIRESIEYKIVDINKIVSYYDIGRQWVIDNLQNPEYKERLKKEVEQNSQSMSTNDELDKYLKEKYSLRLKQVSNNDYVISNDIQKSYGDTKSNAKAFYSIDKNEVYLPLENDSLEAVTNAIHEFSHKITKSEEFLSEKTIKLFSESFDSLSVVANLSSEEERENKNFIKSVVYFSDPTEMYARKKSFEYDLERLGVKKYEEKFTLKHYLRALKLKKEGKFSSDSEEFLYFIKPNMIKKVMNEIADINSSQKKTENIV
jgi:hypothetical protein